MQTTTRLLNAVNIDNIISEFESSLVDLGKSIDGKVGIPLLLSIKRGCVGHGPYPNVTFFEAANRIMSDLVILHGVAGLLKQDKFPFKEYKVEFGNENHNDFDLQASSSTDFLIGEAFNVAPSFFQGKKSHALKKLKNKGSKANYQILMFNSDAIDASYCPKHRKDKIYYVVVDVSSKSVTVIS